MRGDGGGGVAAAGSQQMSTAVYITWHGAQKNFEDLTPYLTYAHPHLPPRTPWRFPPLPPLKISPLPPEDSPHSLLKIPPTPPWRFPPLPPPRSPPPFLSDPKKSYCEAKTSPFNPRHRVYSYAEERLYRGGQSDYLLPSTSTFDPTGRRHSFTF